MSTYSIYHSVIRKIEQRIDLSSKKKLLDIGSGKGELIRLVKEKWDLSTFACDYTDKWMEVKNQKVEVVDLNTDPLPYSDNSFDIITCTEVVEHLNNYRKLLQEMYRVLKPQGLVVISTPNLLNLKSRMRFFSFGFWNLFGPLPFDHVQREDTDGHINPVHFFYLVHGLHEAGFSKIEISVDKYQRSSMIALSFFYLPIKFFGAISFFKEQAKYRTIQKENLPYVTLVNSLDLMLGRTVIATGRKLYER
ncbi:2-polyprenyl-3-methyl-5-hydroxy-6-metoxy-1,4-benzoquinol methylase [Methylacidiphilum kamchatkense Kam1]|uniref:2-polyprenyl-3-methyl-5-hydroxy-6-metoxy-1, 4-benzoquinol methylase n=1 Tax=Methylacidiphilum kamchatkense Kam1 TaxID=1202785 RepID=A0A0C1UR83_9BACT|nr:class I SAM-dependent methyltransferase [Methylacidiphilum kamchatkense]KIE58794.1 2-polyprenyl-3-methyl-5-hydroxy-6-metoxy-1,4-benzoquinol methylase [Methylacidiphilum kamchatkense Kam1]QDQ41797.1 methyltransferase family protein [Methylacidiphilum kamchatkense Kam1]